MLVTTSKQAKLSKIYMSKIYCLIPSIFLLAYAALMTNDIIDEDGYYYYLLLYIVLTNVVEYILRKVSRAYIVYDSYQTFRKHRPNYKQVELTRFYQGMANDKIKSKVKIDDIIVIEFKKRLGACLTSEEYHA